MKIIFAQGNPDKHYENTRHNVGFIIINHFADLHGVSFGPKPKFHADIAELAIEGEKVLLVKPQTYYNDTGRSARTITDFYKLDPSKDLLVIHDELALPFGTIRTRPDGSDAGNNGIKSLNAHLGDGYHRIRIGVYNSLRDQIPDADFVLSNFTADEKDGLDQVIEQTERFILEFIQDKLESTKITIK